MQSRYVYEFAQQLDEMVRVSIARPSSEHEKRHAFYCAKLGPNHDRAGYSRLAPLPKDVLQQESWHEICESIVLGEGEEVFQQSKSALKRWGQFQLDWARVNPDTPLFIHYAYCNSVKVFLPWMINPLRVEYIDNVNKTVNGGMSFAYGTTTLHGHMLQGEERFKIDWNKLDDTVRFEIYSFSRPGNAVAWLSQPITHQLQSAFVKQSLQSMEDIIHPQSQL